MGTRYWQFGRLHAKKRGGIPRGGSIPPPHQSRFQIKSKTSRYRSYAPMPGVPLPSLSPHTLSKAQAFISPTRFFSIRAGRDTRRLSVTIRSTFDDLRFVDCFLSSAHPPSNFNHVQSWSSTSGGTTNWPPTFDTAPTLKPPRFYD